MSKKPSTAAQSFKELIHLDDLPSLGPRRRASAWPEAEVLRRVDEWLQARALTGPVAEALRGCALLWHDHLAAAHGIAQGLSDANGSFLHAVMHRREPDYWNSKYWWNRVGAHPAFPSLAGRVLESVTARQDPDLACHFLASGRWDPAAFVDACEAVADEPADADVPRFLREVQRLEFEALVETLLANH